jgi:hypothetical protein
VSVARELLSAAELLQLGVTANEPRQPALVSLALRHLTTIAMI